MTKLEAMAELGCTNQAQLAEALGVTRGAVCQWPDNGPLPDSVVRRVESLLYRRTRTGSGGRRNRV